MLPLIILLAIANVDPGLAETERVTLKCYDGTPAACVQLGLIYLGRHDGAKHVQLAAALFSGACNARNAEGCGHLGWLFAFGAGVPVDAVRAHRLYKRGCSMGDVDFSCRVLHGDHVPTAPADIGGMAEPGIVFDKDKDRLQAPFLPARKN